MSERLYRAIGLMSGTSMDGIDLAMIETDGETRVTFGPWASVAYDADMRMLLARSLDDAVSMRRREERPGRLAEAERRITGAHVSLTRSFLAASGVDPATVDVVGFHGQTVLHRPEAKLTVQLGDGAALSNALHLPVVFDMRAADVAAGGQGAPLVPAYHQALFEASSLDGPVAIVNLGGIGNLTWCTRGRHPVAFDTGPANALIDDLMKARTGAAMDQDGQVAGSGIVAAETVSAMLSHPYFAAPLPKSLDRKAFALDAVAHLSTPDAAATLTAFTAASLAASARVVPGRPRLWVLAGGGARNPVLVAAIRAALPDEVRIADELGWSSALMEAQAFAYLAVRSLRGLPLTFPTTTGAPRPLTGGLLARPDRRAA